MSKLLEKLSNWYYACWARATKTPVLKKIIAWRLEILRNASLKARLEEKSGEAYAESAEAALEKLSERGRKTLPVSNLNKVLEAYRYSKGVERERRVAQATAGFDKRVREQANEIAEEIMVKKKLGDESTGQAWQARKQRIRLANLRRKYKGRPPLKLN